jgi:cellulose synthase/poly-beta-1,6-N-acetylglucosamine synthase-like glycosyltransferase
MLSTSLAQRPSAPLISVIIPTHNRPDTLAEALASVQAQTFTDYEIIVVSNGESDGMRHQTHAVAVAHRAQYFALDKGSVSIPLGTLLNAFSTVHIDQTAGCCCWPMKQADARLAS